MKSTRIFKNPYKVFCDVYSCRNQATHFIGRPDATLAVVYRICDECLQSMLGNLPDELKEIVAPPAPVESHIKRTVVEPAMIEIDGWRSKFKASLEKKKYVDLKLLAKTLEIPKYSEMNKPEIVEALVKKEAEGKA